MQIGFDEYYYRENEQDILKITTDEITILEPLTIIKGYYQNDNNIELKHYQFFLYKDKEKNNLIGGSNRVYSRSAPIFYCENLNDESVYYLELECTSQDNEVKSATLTVNVKYRQKSMFGELNILTDKSNAKNDILFKITEITGVGYDSDGDENENIAFYTLTTTAPTTTQFVDLLNGNYVIFNDDNGLISENFLCRVWLFAIPTEENPKILTLINGKDKTEYIEVIYKDNKFLVYKHSCGLISYYTSGEIGKCETDKNTLREVYLALGYYNGRINIQTKVIEVAR